MNRFDKDIKGMLATFDNDGKVYRVIGGFGAVPYTSGAAVFLQNVNDPEDGFRVDGNDPGLELVKE